MLAAVIVRSFSWYATWHAAPHWKLLIVAGMAVMVLAGVAALLLVLFQAGRK